MKKTIAVTALVAIIGLTGFYQASAYMGMREGGDCNGHQYQGMMAATAQMDEATKAKFSVFFKDTQELRKAIVVKRAEKQARMRSEKPDAKKVGELAGELFDLRTSMHAKAEAAGLGDYVGMRGGCRGNGGQKFHHGQKGKMRGQGMMKGHGMMKGQGMMDNQTPAQN